jgi:hypothetical protein
MSWRLPHLRLEWRNFDYSGDQPDSSTLRLRNRVELLYPLNRPRIGDDGALYVPGDAEWFWTAEDLADVACRSLLHLGSIAWRGG